MQCKRIWNFEHDVGRTPEIVSIYIYGNIFFCTSFPSICRLGATQALVFLFYFENGHGKRKSINFKIGPVKKGVRDAYYVFVCVWPCGCGCGCFWGLRQFMVVMAIVWLVFGCAKGLFGFSLLYWRRLHAVFFDLYGQGFFRREGRLPEVTWLLIFFFRCRCFTSVHNKMNGPRKRIERLVFAFAFFFLVLPFFMHCKSLLFCRHFIAKTVIVKCIIGIFLCWPTGWMGGIISVWGLSLLNKNHNGTGSPMEIVRFKYSVYFCDFVYLNETTEVR